MRYIGTLAICMATAITLAAVPQKALDPQTIEDKVTIHFDQEVYLQFKAKGSRLIEPKSYKGKNEDKSMIKVELMEGGPVPGRVLVVNNHFERPLVFRALVRLKDNPEFVELKGLKPADPQQCWCHFWHADKPIEEAILYDFRLTDAPPKDE